MEKLQDLSQSELQDLLDNSERVESMALESDEIQNIQLEREMALAANRSLAEQNLDMKPRLEKERARLVEKYTELEQVREKYKQHCALRDSIMGQLSPEGLLSRLQIEGANKEEESEALADEFLEGSISLDSFFERFLSFRSLAHMRRVRIEKLQEILCQKNKGIGDAKITSQPCANQDARSSSPWQQQQPQHQQSSKISAPSNATSSALPYSPYPVPPPSHLPSASSTVPTNPSTAFRPYPSQGSPFPPSTSYSIPRPAFGPPACPYPTQPSFPGPPFGHFGHTPAPYPNPYQYGGFAYPTGPNGPSNQSPAARPLYRPGFGVPQPYS
ncbi:vacuolar protein sorting-associated protein 37C-like isoform X2 [Xyrauchen texanus]|nr:vacuolar protein sorting-associated protein 37C-like isoform X2 [Xyrauchen texanus]